MYSVFVSPSFFTDSLVRLRRQKYHPQPYTMNTLFAKVYMSLHLVVGSKMPYCNFLLGFEIPDVGCTSPLGMEKGTIPDSAIVASSRYNQYAGPERARLNLPKQGTVPLRFVLHFCNIFMLADIFLMKSELCD